MFAEEFVVCAADSALWRAARPLLNAALTLERQDEHSCWHGWQKQQIAAFLEGLPAHCALLAGVWETETAAEGEDEQERLTLGIICEVVNGEIRSVRTFEALADPKLPAITELEPGFEHARELLRATKEQVAPVAWALFTDRATWQEWLLVEDAAGRAFDKGELLASLARQGRCVLMGNRAMHHHM